MPSWDINKNMSDQTGKVAIVTGGNTGIGKETVRHLALHNAKVYMASRTESRATAAIEELNKEHPELAQKAGISFLQLDLSSLESCQAAAKTFLEKENRLDILINNAGIMANPYELTPDGFESQFQSNYLGHYTFTIPLLPLLIKTSKNPDTSVRIVQVSSVGHNFATKDVKFDSIESINREFSNTWQRYGQSKLANVLFAKELATRLSGERIFSSVVHPGNINTELNRGTVKSYPCLRPVISLVNNLGPVLKLLGATPYQGAITPLYAATATEIEQNNWRGEWFEPFAKNAKPSELGQNPELAHDLWDLSERIVKEKTGYVPEAL